MQERVWAGIRATTVPLLSRTVTEAGTLADDKENVYSPAGRSYLPQCVSLANVNPPDAICACAALAMPMSSIASMQNERRREDLIPISPMSDWGNNFCPRSELLSDLAVRSRR